jgi:hypothetical protein
MGPDEELKQRIGEEVAEHTARYIARVVAAVVGGTFLAVLLGFLLGWVIQFLWNATLAEMFDWPTIGFWQAFGMFILAKILIGFGGSGGGQHKSKRDQERDRERMRAWWRRRSATPPTDDSGLTTSEMFRQYWQEEGKAAYEAYRATHEGKERSAPSNE